MIIMAGKIVWAIIFATTIFQYTEYSKEIRKLKEATVDKDETKLLKFERIRRTTLLLSVASFLVFIGQFIV